MSYLIRLMKPGEAGFLKEMQYEALYVPKGSAPFPREIVENPAIAKYYENWGRPGDMAIVAVDQEAEILVGAIWARRFTAEHPGYGFVDEQTPELSIALRPPFRAQGIGTKLLGSFISLARQKKIAALSLSVDGTNPALRLYLRFGFKEVKPGDSPTLLLKL